MENKKRYLVLGLILSVAVFCLFISIIYPGIFFSSAFYGYMTHFCVSIIVDFLVLVVLLCILRRFSTILSRKFMLYIAIAAAGGSVIGFLLFAVYQLFVESACVSYEHRWAYILVEFGLLAIFNFALSKVIFNVKIREACFIGITMGLINAFIGMAPFCY